MRRYYTTIFAFIVLFTSCSPKYRLEKIYIPSKTDQTCIEKCRKEKYRCEKECLKQRDRCLKDALLKAKKIYTYQKQIYREKLKRYFKQYDRYITEYKLWQDKYLRLNEDYQYYTRKCKIDKNWCNEKEYYKKLLEDWIRLKPEKPQKPKEPSFREILKQQQSLCLKDCCCNTDFDICFQSCGGKIIFKKICIENCD